MEKSKRRRVRGEGSLYQRDRIWWVQYRAYGKVYRESAKTEKKTEAIEFLTLRQGELAQGQRPGRDFEKTTFEDLKEIYWEHFTKKQRKDRRRQEIAIGHLDKIFKGRKAVEIDDRLIKRYEDMRLSEEASVQTVSRELSVLKTILKKGVERHKVLAGRMPVIEMHPAAPPRKGFITREECEKLLVVLPDWLRPVVSFAFQTGWRRNEVVNLRWDEVNLNDRVIILPGRRSKNGEDRPIYIDDAVFKILQEQRRKQFAAGARAFEYVFHRMRSTRGSRTERKANLRAETIGDFRKIWSDALKKAGLPETLIFHDLRRSAIREMTRMGYRERTAMEVSGHKTRSVFDRYNIVDLSDQKAAAEERQAQILNGHN